MDEARGDQPSHWGRLPRSIAFPFQEMPMSIRSRTRHARRAFAGPAAPLTRKTPRRLPAAVEALEHRLVLSTYTVTTLADTADANNGVTSCVGSAGTPADHFTR